MKKNIFYIVLLLLPVLLPAQITTPVIRANFGVDADVRHNFFNGSTLADNDDWFSNADSGNGVFVIDTTGAAAIVSAYTTNPGSKLFSFARGMRYPMLSTIGGRIYYDASYIKDFHGTDSTAFAGSCKNGQSPQLWNVPISSPVPDKNDIGEVYLHVRRDGSNSTDSLWFFGAVSLLGVTGNRYFDFELYQTDITFNRSLLQFQNYGPDAGHTTWQFNASGQTTQVGDIIFTAEYDNSSLSALEARIWININSLNATTPLAFDWTGSFDGDGASATYGYAGIRPKNGGTFYTGLQNATSRWAGSFGTIKNGDVYSANYDPVQFMEFSVNLSKLGLDPMTFTTGSMCNLAFGKVLVKTRTSTSFSATLTDFVSPFSFRSIALVEAYADFPVFCHSQNISTISVLNPLSTSTYSWSTPNGHIIGTNTGVSITVDSPGIYIVIQQLLNGCSENGRDSVVIARALNNDCSVLNSQLKYFTVQKNQEYIQLNWSVTGNTLISKTEAERAGENKQFKTIADVPLKQSLHDNVDYTFFDDKLLANESVFNYRIKITEHNGTVYYSEVKAVRTALAQQVSLQVNPNPVTSGAMNIFLSVVQKETACIKLFHTSGSLLFTEKRELVRGNNNFHIQTPGLVQPGLYILHVSAGAQTVYQKVIVQ